MRADCRGKFPCRMGERERWELTVEGSLPVGFGERSGS